MMERKEDVEQIIQKAIENLASLRAVRMCKCPKCGKEYLEPIFESYKDEGSNYIKLYLKCNNCGAKFVLMQPFVEY